MGTINGSYILQSRPIHKRTLGYSIQSLGRSKEKMRIGPLWTTTAFGSKLDIKWTNLCRSQSTNLEFWPIHLRKSFVSSTTSMPPAHACGDACFRLDALPGISGSHEPQLGDPTDSAFWDDKMNQGQKSLNKRHQDRLEYVGVFGWSLPMSEPHPSWFLLGQLPSELTTGSITTGRMPPKKMICSV